MDGPFSLRGAILGSASSLVSGSGLRGLSRRVHALMRTVQRKPATIHYFHGVDDPYSHLCVQILPELAARYGVAIVPHLVGQPDNAVVPDRDRLADWSIRDAGQLARAHGLLWPDDATRPDDATVRAVQSTLASIADVAPFAAAAMELGHKLWSGQRVTDTAVNPTARLAAGNAALAAAGHYLPAVFAFEGESYWGVDRLPHLEARLADRREGPPLVRRLEASDAPGDAGGVALHFYLSFRSPYTHIAAARVRRLAERHGATLVLRPVLPMVMRGLPVPKPKRLYIVRDTKREAERLGIMFGRICDPVGAGVERGLAVLHRAIAMGRGPDFAESFLAGAFAEAVDATTDAGLRLLADRAGISSADVADALADDSWRAVAAANAEELFGLGLWGVPSFRVGMMPPHWGQDRLWAVEQDLRRHGGRSG